MSRSGARGPALWRWLLQWRSRPHPTLPQAELRPEALGLIQRRTRCSVWTRILCWEAGRRQGPGLCTRSDFCAALTSDMGQKDGSYNKR